MKACLALVLGALFASCLSLQGCSFGTKTESFLYKLLVLDVESLLPIDGAALEGKHLYGGSFQRMTDKSGSCWVAMQEPGRLTYVHGSYWGPLPATLTLTKEGYVPRTWQLAGDSFRRGSKETEHEYSEVVSLERKK